VGNFAQVFLAVEKRSGFLVTLKKIKKSLLKNKKCEDQLMTEIKIQMFANHPNILKIYGCYSDDQTVTLILEFM
jgi:serine/threonine protein kinase